MSLSDLIRSYESNTNIDDPSRKKKPKPFQVKIGPVTLGVRDPHPDESQPNPTKIVWSQNFTIVEHKTIGQKPLTQCTIPDGLWCLDIEMVMLKGPDEGLSTNLTTLSKMGSGPYMVHTALFSDGKCMYFTKKVITQRKGSKDWYQTVEISMIESNAGE